MLVTENDGPIGWLAYGRKDRALSNRPRYWQGQNGMLGVYVSPNFATDESIYLTYIEPGDYGGGQVLARAKLNLQRAPRLQDFTVLWRQMPRGKGGQAGGQVVFSADGQYLFMTVGDRQRMTPAQDPDQPVGKILRITRMAKTSPGNPNSAKPVLPPFCSSIRHRTPKLPRQRRR